MDRAELLRSYAPYLVNTGGNAPVEMVEGPAADPRVNLPLSTLQACVKSQVTLLERLHVAGLLREAGEDGTEEIPIPD